MVDIEAKTLDYLKSNLASIEAIKEQDLESLIGEATFINSWNAIFKMKKYFDLTEAIIKSERIDELWSRLSVLAERYKITNSEKARMFYAVVGDFKDFFKKIYEIYLLDQILAILIQKEEITDQNLIPRETKSVYYEYRFGLDLIQETLDSESLQQNVDITFFKIKEYYVNELKRLLEKEEYYDRFKRLKETCRDISIKPQNNNWYVANMFIFLGTLKLPNKQMIRVRTPRIKNIKNQLTLFDN